MRTEKEKMACEVLANQLNQLAESLRDGHYDFSEGAQELSCLFDSVSDALLDESGLADAINRKAFYFV